MVRLHTILAFSLLVSFAVRAGDRLSDLESKYYRIITLPTPKDVQFESGALLLLSPDKIMCSTRIGDIWVAEGITSDNPTPKWTQFASGLHEVLGLAQKDGWIYCTQRGEVTRMKDTNGDGKADIFETVNDDW